jgi:hypothetical protein
VEACVQDVIFTDSVQDGKKGRSVGIHSIGDSCDTAVFLSAEGSGAASLPIFSLLLVPAQRMTSDRQVIPQEGIWMEGVRISLSIFTAVTISTVVGRLFGQTQEAGTLFACIVLRTISWRFRIPVKEEEASLKWRRWK